MRRRIFSHLLPWLLVPLVVAAGASVFLLQRPLSETHAWGDFLLALLIGFVAAIVLGWVLALRRAGRRGQFLDLAAALREGDLSARLPEKPEQVGDESVGAWNMAAERLQRKFDELEAVRLQLTTLLNSMQEGVIAVDRGGRVTWANGIVEEMTEHRVAIGSAVVQTIRDPEVLACLQAALQEGTVHRQISRSIQPGRTLEVTAGPMPGGALAVLHDVTDLERMEATRRDFIANVSHELRTPLTSITGYVETLMDDESFDDEKRDFLSIILKNARRMNRLTEDLLALARVESGEHKLRLEAVPASLLLTDALDALGGLVDDHGMLLEIAFNTDRPVLADRDAMHQVLSNLIENAAKYAGDGQRILLGAMDRGSSVELFVQDFGPGIRSEHLQRIFERFYRVDKARSVESGGTGLGLAIANHIMLAHKGNIRAESVLNRGCTFLLTLPPADPLPEAGEADPISAETDLAKELPA
jgi:two-component system, OmpR family, phosphate regulon sensor histidine kinase PhoR